MTNVRARSPLREFVYRILELKERIPGTRSFGHCIWHLLKGTMRFLYWELRWTRLSDRFLTRYVVMFPTG